MTHITNISNAFENEATAARSALVMLSVARPDDAEGVVTEMQNLAMFNILPRIERMERLFAQLQQGAINQRHLDHKADMEKQQSGKA